MYRGTGVCEITALVEKRFGDQTQECYALVPLYLNNLTIYVPMNLEHRMAELRNGEEIEEGLRHLSEVETVWIADVHTRRKKYREILLDGTYDEGLQVLKTLYLAKQRRHFRGQKNGLCVSDDHLFHDCKRIIAEEIAYSNGCTYDEAEIKLNTLLDELLSTVQTDK